MTILQPGWLIFILPLIAFLILVPMPGRKQKILRSASLLLMIFAATDPVVFFPQSGGTIVVIADRSRSLPKDHLNSYREIVKILQKNMGENNKLGIVAFGEKSVVEKYPERGVFQGFTQSAGADASNLSDALNLALSLIPKNAPARLLLLTDGNWTGPDPANDLFKAASRNIPVDIRLIDRSKTDDYAIESFEGPTTVSEREGFLINAWVRSNEEKEINYILKRNETVIASGSRKLIPGINRITFRDIFENSKMNKAYFYRFETEIQKDDPFPENNSARLIVTQKGIKPVLFLSSNQTSKFTEALRNNGIPVQQLLPERFSWTLEELAMISAVVLENVPAEKLGYSGMSLLPLWVTELGGGLMMTGGKNSFGPGGYFKSQIEPILPVSLELRSEHRKFKLAIVVALDRSGSMAIDAGYGRKKMDLANLAAAEVLEILSQTDEFGVIAVDSSPHIVVPLSPSENKDFMRSTILRIQSEGGGIFIEEALNASVKMLGQATAETRHIILFADAQDSEEPGKYKEILDYCVKTGISVSVVGLGMPGDVDSELLKDIAARGKGRIFFTEKAEDLPRIFVQDTFVIAKNSFIEEKTAIQKEPGLQSLYGSSKILMDFPAIGGYNMTWLRPGAFPGLKTKDEHTAPLLAFWNVGIGRTLCYTGEIEGKYQGNFAAWNEASDFLASLVRWTAGQKEQANRFEMATTEIRNGCLLVRLNLDPQRWREDYSEPPYITLVRSESGVAPVSQKIKMTWETTDSLVAEISLRDREIVAGSIDLKTGRKIALPPVCLPFSPEYLPSSISKGAENYERILRIGKGKERVELGSIWKDLPDSPLPVKINYWLLLASIAVFLIEIAERRTKFLSIADAYFRKISTSISIPGESKAEENLKTHTEKEEQRTELPQTSLERVEVEPLSSIKNVTEKKDDLLDALKKARKRGSRRND
ncbi:MAG: VWA domain-containing protein [Candidatus Riflebacteria bacterium]|nr:VWA domain-containing protein [Candidatus Riflebacteria bacterium]